MGANTQNTTVLTCQKFSEALDTGATIESCRNQLTARLSSIASRIPRLGESIRPKFAITSFQASGIHLKAEITWKFMSSTNSTVTNRQEFKYVAKLCLVDAKQNSWKVEEDNRDDISDGNIDSILKALREELDALKKLDLEKPFR